LASWDKWGKGCCRSATTPTERDMKLALAMVVEPPERKYCCDGARTNQRPTELGLTAFLTVHGLFLIIISFLFGVREYDWPKSNAMADWSTQTDVLVLLVPQGTLAFLFFILLCVNVDTYYKHIDDAIDLPDAATRTDFSVMPSDSSKSWNKVARFVRRYDPLTYDL